MSEDLKQEVSPLYFSVVIITRNRAKILGDCLESLVGQDFPKDRYDLIVVDDGSTDKTPTVVKSFQKSDVALPEVRYVPQAHQGVNAARNAGIEHARGAVVFFLDDDILASPNHLSRVWGLFSENSDLSGVGGPLRDRGGTHLRTCKHCSLGDIDKPGEGKRLVPILVGGNMALKASTFRQVGLFDPEISGRGDESEWFHRAKGLDFFYDPELWVWHRRDNFTLMMLCRHSFVQGLSIPLTQKKRGTSYYPKPTRLARSLAHALLHGCTWGLVLAFREIGSVLGYMRLVATGR